MSDLKIPLARHTSTTVAFTSARHGTVQVPNPYAWLEDMSSPETASFVESQNKAFAAYVADESLAAAKQQMTATLMEVAKLAITPSLPQRVVGGDYLFRLLGRGKDYGVWYRGRLDSRFQGQGQGQGAAGGGDSVETHGSGDDKDFTVFYDEATYSAVLTASSPSRSGKYWAFTTSEAGSDWGVVHTKDVRSGEILQHAVRGTKFASKPSSVIPWLSDRGFFYPYYPTDTKRGDGESHGDGNKKVPAQLRFHEIGGPQEEDELVYADPDHPGYSFRAVASDDDRFVFLEVYDSGRGCQVWAARVAEEEQRQEKDGSTKTRRLHLKFDGKISDSSEAEWEYVGTSAEDHTHLFWTSADNGKVVSWSPDTGALDEVVPPHERQTLKLARLLPGGHVLVVRSIDVRDQVQIFSRGGQHLRTLDDLPLWTILDVSYDVSAEIVFLLESSFCHPPRIWYARLCLDDRVGGGEGGREEGEGGQPKVETSLTISPLSLLSLFFDPPVSQSPTLSTTQVFYPSLDSTPIPMFLTSTSTPSPTAPILLYIYGGFGISVIPHFRPDFLTFASPSTLGGILAVANIRGGGEYGTQWHRGACKKNRQRVFDDIIAAGRFLRERFSSTGAGPGQGRRNIILMGESMGGLNAATAMTQAPDLFDAVILNAPVVDILHRQRVDRSKRGVEDMGDVNDPGDFDVVYRWSPMEKVLEAGNAEANPNSIASATGGDGVAVGLRYPPVLLTAGDKDDAVSYSNSLKMAAALQRAASRAGDVAPPTHLRIISNLGHGGNISARQKAAVGLERWLWVVKTLNLDVYGG
ncbi:hypothetical protein PV04_01876 [Phialophora macrospora]|uniref:Prolyl endopeptidase n=1 Tax=Phialophora macrospora TaxID=1851006 RepID=A0A0D2GN14_9EURO|nr:hypothetical protein PV04_01876 [Phialophora macrospora]